MRLGYQTLIAALLIVGSPRADLIARQLDVLRIKVTIVDADGRARPVPRHALLISENPSTAAPRRAVTSLDGTAEVRLRPGNYTVESDEPLIFQGKEYQWRQTLDVAPGQVTAIDFTAGNAQIESAASGSSAAGSASALLIDWQNSVVSIWTPTKLGSGFLIDSRGLIATNQRLVARASSVEVQLSPTEKVAARVLAADPDRNVAVLWIDPKAIASARPVKLGLTDGGTAIAEKEKVFAISARFYDEKTLASGTVSRVNTHTIVNDVDVDDHSLGTPLFNAAGLVIAITTAEEDGSNGAPATRIDEARGVIATAEKKMHQSTAPSGALLPVEPQRPDDDEALKEAAKARAGRLAPYRVAAADFDVRLITPVLVYGARHQGDRVSGRERESANDRQASLRAISDFANWEDYVRGNPRVLMIRATPKLVESFWASLARGAAQTQGVSLPPIKHIKAGFARMQVFCGDAEVTPIHPFKIENRVGENDAVYEGLYVFDPAAIGPHCGTVKLTLFSDKNPQKGDTRVVDPKILQQTWADFGHGR